MTDEDLQALVDSVDVPGWSVYRMPGFMQQLVMVEHAEVVDTYHPDESSALREHFECRPEWQTSKVVRRIFTTIQFLTDHELRETFLVGGARPFDPHDQSISERQHEWFILKESALLGYAGL